MSHFDAVNQRLRKEIQRRLARAAACFATAAKKTLSVPAPRKVSKKTGRPYATTRAIPGAPPRKLSGRGRASVAWKMTDGNTASVVGTNVGYMVIHERSARHPHPWVKPTLDRERARITDILHGRA